MNINLGSHNNLSGVSIGSTTTDITSPLFKPMSWCGQQWKSWAHLPEDESKIASVLKKMAVFVPLIFATVGAAAIGLVGLVLLPCGVVKIETTYSSPINIRVGSGIPAEKIHDLSARLINNVNLRGSGTVHITSGDSNSLKVQADDNLINLLDPMFGAAEELILRGNVVPMQPSLPITYHLTLTESLKDFTLSGAGQIHIDSIHTPSFSCEIRGSGEVHIKEGKVEEQIVTISGSGEYLAPNLESKHSKIEIRGSGDAEVQATDTLAINIAGSGDCVYHGNPKVTKSIKGSGSIAKAS